MDSYKEIQSSEDEKKLIGNISEFGENGHWSSKLTELGIKEFFEKEGVIINKPFPKENTSDCKTPNGKIKTYEPDFETNDYVIEVKGCAWITSGTAGEKILGTPLKYSEVPNLYGKPLIIILVGYQEWEGRYGFAAGDLINPQIRGNKNFVNLMKKIHKSEIYYIGFSDLLNGKKIKEIIKSKLI